MSYCRWSDDNWESDIYAYPHVNGFYAIHVAGRKRVGHITPLPDITKVTAEEFYEAYKKQRADLKKCELVPIGLPYDGMIFDEPDLESAIARMKVLKEAGYHVPQWAIETMEDELKELAEE